MKGFYRLVTIELSSLLSGLLILCIGIIAIPQLLLMSELKRYSVYTGQERFEAIYTSAGCMMVFIVGLAVLCGLFIYNIYSGYQGSKSIYTYLTLPVRRETVYSSKLAAYAISLLLFIAAQLISARFGYGIVASRIANYNDGQMVMTNGLFLAFTRSEFLRMLLPLSWNGLLSSFSMLAAIVSGLYYGVLCERSKRYGWLALIAVAIILIIQELSYRMGMPVYYASFSDLYLRSGLLLILSGWYVVHGSRLVVKGAIA